MDIYELKTPVKIYYNAEYGNRLIFVKGPTNPRDELGKNGITFHNRFSRLFHNTIQLHLDLINKDNKRSQRLFYVNKNSLSKYLQAFNSSFNAKNKTNKQLVEELRTHLWEIDNLNDPGEVNAKKQGKVGEKSLRHAGTHNKSQLSGFKSTVSSALTGKLIASLYQNAIGDFNRLRILYFLFARKEADQLEKSELLARTRFKQTADTVPAYKQHLANHGEIKSGAIFADIPITSKDNYIKKNTSKDWDLHIGGRYPRYNKTDTSTGTTGKPTPWVRSDREVEIVKKSLKIATEIVFDKRPLEFINTVAFGPWATGMTTYELMRNIGSVFASGPDMEKILDKLEGIYTYQQAQLEKAVASFISKNKALKGKSEQVNLIVSTMVHNLLSLGSLGSITSNSFPDFKKYFSKLKNLAFKVNAEKAQIIIGGYPPFLKDLIDYAAKKGINFKKYQARALVGGQAISEALRDKLITGGFLLINSSYGASDLDINLGLESDFELGLRKAIEKNPGLARELYGNNKGLPMVFGYDPLNYHIEVLDDDELIFTCNRSDRSSPRIRYDLGDKGRVYAISDIDALLVKYSIHNLKHDTNLPLLFVWGREADVIYAGANVGFTDLERAITTEDTSAACLKYAFYSYEDKEGVEQFDIWIELKEGVTIPDKKESESFLANILTRMANANQDFAYQLKNLPLDTELPAVRFFSRKMSPIQDADGHRKQVLIFKSGKNLDEHYHYPEKETDSARYTIKMTQDFLATLNAKSEAKEMKQPRRNSSLLQFTKTTASSLEQKSHDNPIFELDKPVVSMTAK